MSEWLSRAYRGMATGVCFAVFGLGGLAISVTVFPLLMLLVRDERLRQRVGKWVMRQSFHFFFEFMRFTGVLRYRVKHLERLSRPGLLIVANHPSLIDVVFLLGLLERANCIVRSTLLRNPFMRYPILAAGLVPNGEGGVDLLDRCIQSMNSGDALLVFPEGSRSEPTHLLPFQRGAAHLAVRARKDVTPVVIRVSEHNLGRHSVWWRAPRRRIDYEFEIKEDIPIQPLLERHPEPPAAARELTAQLRQYFEEELEIPCRAPTLSNAS